VFFFSQVDSRFPSGCRGEPHGVRQGQPQRGVQRLLHHQLPGSRRPRALEGMAQPPPGDRLSSEDGFSSTERAAVVGTFMRIYNVGRSWGENGSNEFGIIGIYTATNLI